MWAMRYHHIRAVYDVGGVSPTLCAGMGEGGGVVPKIMEVNDDSTRGEGNSKEN